MAPQATHPRFAHAPRRRGEDRPTDGAWWPDTRKLEAQLTHLFSLWPRTHSRISRVQYSPADWDDQPRMVAVGGGWLVKTENLLHDDAHRIVLTLADGSRQSLEVIAPATSPDVASRRLQYFRSSAA